MIKYIGSKRPLLPLLRRVFAALGDDVHVVLDAFSGTSRVGHALKADGHRVIANDHNAYAHALGVCYVQADRDDWEREATALLGELASLPPRAGWFTETYCEKSRFFQPKNGARIEAIRDAIETMRLPDELRAVALVSLMEAADRVDSTTGLQMAFLKQWSARSHRELELRLPALLPRARAGKGEAWSLDAAAAIAAGGGAIDAIYLDPPYNQHSYLGNYHVWETLVRWDRPEVYGVAHKRADVRERASPFNRRRQARAAFAALLAAAEARWIVVSFSDEGYLPRAELESMLGARGEVTTLAVDYKRYVGAQIGVFNPRGERVGEVSHLRNVEHVFIVGPRRLDVAALTSDGRAPPGAQRC
jgi:adenine-specific DNA-methyltransferase